MSTIDCDLFERRVEQETSRWAGETAEGRTGEAGEGGGGREEEAGGAEEEGGERQDRGWDQARSILHLPLCLLVHSL